MRLVFSIHTHTLSSTFYSCQVRMCPVCGHFLDIPLTFAPCHVAVGDYIIDVGEISALVRFANPNNINHLVSLHLKESKMETIHTIDTPELTAKLNKAEIDILQYIDSWLPTLTDWSVDELTRKCRLFRSDADDAIDMLILHGLLDNAGSCEVTGRRVSVPEIAARWMRENTETINSIKLMNDTDLYDDTEIAES